MKIENIWLAFILTSFIFYPTVSSIMIPKRFRTNGRSIISFQRNEKKPDETILDLKQKLNKIKNKINTKVNIYKEYQLYSMLSRYG